eukprot:SAG11_NODE_8965_length_958_cov_1.196740_1_plen_146_part_00
MINSSIRYIPGTPDILEYIFIFDNLAWQYWMVVCLFIIKLWSIWICNRTVEIDKFKFSWMCTHKCVPAVIIWLNRGIGYLKNIFNPLPYKNWQTSSPSTKDEILFLVSKFRLRRCGKTQVIEELPIWYISDICPSRWTVHIETIK